MGQRWEGVVMEEGRQHLWAQCPERWEKDMGQGGREGRAKLVAPVLGLLQSWPSLDFKSCSDHMEGSKDGEGSLDKLAHTTDVCSEKYSKIVMQR